MIISSFQSPLAGCSHIPRDIFLLLIFREIWNKPNNWVSWNFYCAILTRNHRKSRMLWTGTPWLAAKSESGWNKKNIRQSFHQKADFMRDWHRQDTESSSSLSIVEWRMGIWFSGPLWSCETEPGCVCSPRLSWRGTPPGFWSPGAPQRLSSAQRTCIRPHGARRPDGRPKDRVRRPAWKWEAMRGKGEGVRGRREWETRRIVCRERKRWEERWQQEGQIRSEREEIRSKLTQQRSKYPDF